MVYCGVDSHVIESDDIIDLSTRPDLVFSRYHAGTTGISLLFIGFSPTFHIFFSYFSALVKTNVWVTLYFPWRDFLLDLQRANG